MRARTCWSWCSRVTWFLAVVGLRSFSLDVGSSLFDVVVLTPPCTIANLQPTPPSSSRTDFITVNPLMDTGNYSATWNNMKLVVWPLMGGLLHLVQRGGDWAGRHPARPLLAVPNVTANPSTASVPIIVLLYNGTLLCGFNVPMCSLDKYKTGK